MSARVYVPTTLAGLGLLVDEGLLPASPDVVVAPDDDEETEYDAMMTAAEYLQGSHRRVVVVAVVDDPDGPVPLDRVVAVHADPTERVAPTRDDDLAWYAVSEIPVLLGRV
jgi:hypothetical protein